MLSIYGWTFRDNKGPNQISYPLLKVLTQLHKVCHLCLAVFACKSTQNRYVQNKLMMSDIIKNVTYQSSNDGQVLKQLVRPLPALDRRQHSQRRCRQTWSWLFESVPWSDAESQGQFYPWIKVSASNSL